MLKNLKIDEATHKKLSMRACELGTFRGPLADVLICAALEHLSDEQIRELFRNRVTCHDNDAKPSKPEKPGRR